MQMTVDRHAINGSIDIPHLDDRFDNPVGILSRKVTVFGRAYKIYFGIFWTGLSPVEGTKYELIVFRSQSSGDMLMDLTDSDGPTMRTSVDMYVYTTINFNSVTYIVAGF
jgi:hypothetical protein